MLFRLCTTRTFWALALAAAVAVTIGSMQLIAALAAMPMTGEARRICSTLKSPDAIDQATCRQ